MTQNTLIKKEKNIADAFNDSHDDSGDPVTKGYFRGYMEAFSISTNEKIEKLKTDLRGDMSDLKSELRVDMKVLRDEFSELKGEMRSFREDTNQKFDQFIQSINAQTQELRNQNAELRMKTDAFERYLIGDEEDKQKINSRLNRLESKVLLA